MLLRVPVLSLLVLGPIKTGAIMIDPTFARRGLFLVFVILLLDIIGIAIIMPVLPAYLEQLTGA